MLSTKLRGFLAEIQGEKTAAAKKASGTEPGSIGGSTTHPVKDVDDQTRKATEGARSAENSADVKETVMLGGADGAADKGPDQESVQFNVGVTSTETGKDPANEDNYKGDKDDPGTTHPAKTEDGEKYAAMSFAQLKAQFEKNANDIMAGLVAGGTAPAKAPAAKQAAAPAPDTTAGKAAALKAASAGYDMAAKAAQEKAASAEKAAMERAVEETIRNGLAMATMTGNYLRTYEKQALAKRAEEEGGDSEGGESKPKEKKESGGDSEGGGKKPGGESGGDSSGGEGGGAIPGADAGLLGDMAGGGAGGGGAPAPGGDPMAGGAPGGGGGQGDAIQQILMALMEMGVTPDQIIAQLQGAGGGAGGGMGGPPPGGDPMGGMGGPPPGGDPLAALGAGGGDPTAGGDPTKIAAARKHAAANKRRQDLFQLMKTAKAYQRSGKFRITEAKTAAEQRLRGEIKKCLVEIVG